MKLLAVIAILAAIVLFVWALARVLRDLGQRLAAHEWRWKERKIPGQKLYGVYLVPPGAAKFSDWEMFGEPISQRLPEHEFQEILIERRIGAQERIDTLNRRLNA